MLIKDFLRGLEQIVPLAAIGYERDAVGLQVGNGETTELECALFAYEVTEEVIEEARSLGANLIVAYHPLIFPSLLSVNDSSRSGKLARGLIRADIALYVQHTAFDSQPEFGTSRLMAEVLELDNVRPLAPLNNTLNKIVVFAPHSAARAVSEALARGGAGRIRNYDECSFQVEGRGTFRGNENSNPTTGERTVLESVDEVRIEMVCERWNTSSAIRAMLEVHPYEEPAYDVFQLASGSVNYGMGAIGEWPKATQVEELLDVVKKAFGTPSIRFNRTSNAPIDRVAMLGGSGMEFYSAAIRARAGAFITADVRYHDFHRARHDDCLLIDAGHAETERFVVQGMLRAARAALKQSLVATADEREEHGASEKLLIHSRAETNAVYYF